MMILKKRIKQFIKRGHKIDFTPLIKGEDITDSGWSANKNLYKKTSSGDWDPKHYTKLHEQNTKRTPTQLQSKN